MSINIEKIKEFCRFLEREAAQAYPGLEIYFLFHKKGKLRESIALAEHEVITHHAGQAACHILKRHHKNDRSNFMGLAISQESKWFGFKKIDHLLGLVNVNEDQFKTNYEAVADILHQVWHAIDLYEIRQSPQYRHRFKTGPMVPKRSDMNLSKAHMQADAFAACIMVLLREECCIDLLAHKRGVESLSPITDVKSEDFPFVIARDACDFAIQELSLDDIPKEEILTTAREVSLDVGYAFDSSNIQQWWDFAIPSQDMAWRGYSKEEILSAAIHTSSSPFVRSIGYLIQEVTNIEPVLESSIQTKYNAFVDPEVNLKLHRELVDTIFEEAMVNDQDYISSALRDAANRQNEDLTEGRFLGWCANALQDAAKAFDNARIQGASPSQAARMEFKGNLHAPSWDELKDLGDSIIDQKRTGFAVTMGHIAEICHNNDAFAPVLSSIKMTMNDPTYIQKLEAANDLAIRPTMPTPNAPAPRGPEVTAEPKGPAPKGPAPTEPTPAMPPMAPSMPGLGGSNHNHLMRQKQLAAQKAAQEKAKKDSETTSDQT